MKKYRVSFGQLKDYKHPSPETTSVTHYGVFDDCVLTVYKTREEMMDKLRKSEKKTLPH